MKKLIILFSFLFPLLLQSQQVSLEELTNQAISNFGFDKNIETLNNINQFNIENADKNYLPQLNLGVQATYQSDVTSVPLSLPNMEIPSPPKEQFKATLTVNQVIYDGNATKQQKVLIENVHQTEVLKFEDQKRSIKEKVSELFFAALSIQNTKDILQLKYDELNQREKSLQTAVDAGVLLNATLLEFQAEKLKLNNQLQNLEKQNQSVLMSLQSFTGVTINQDQKFTPPSFETLSELNFDERTDIKLLEANKQVLATKADMQGIKAKPKVMAFGTAGYGRPGLNMLSDQLDPYYLVGAKLSWDFWDWGQTKNQRQIIALQQNLISENEENLKTQLAISYDNLNAEIIKLEQSIFTDNQLIKLRKEIKNAYATQLENGTLSATDYLQYLNAEQEALLQKQQNEIQLLKTKQQLLLMQ